MSVSVLPAVGRFLRATGNAALVLADELAGMGTAPAPISPPVAPSVPLTGLGHRQQQVVQELQKARSAGERTGVIAAVVGMDHPNTLLTLRALEKKGIAELVPGSKPQQWRLVQNDENA